MIHLRAAIAAFGLAAIPLQPARANDSEAEVGIGGLELKKNGAISMDSEDLYISQGEVRVRYRFTNRSARDVETLVSFPVPMLPDGIKGHYSYTSMPDYNRLEFRTTIDGRPAPLDYVQRAEVAGRDVTSLLTAMGWPLRWFDGADGPPAFLAALAAKDKAAFLRDGLLRRSPDDPATVIPAWNIVTHVTRSQLFPAGKTVEVTHRYVPIAGGSVGGGLYRPVRKGEGEARYRRKYCTDTAFFAGFDRRIAGLARSSSAGMSSEVWLSYILRPGANWRGPIGDFRLVIDKGKPGNLVSFCMDGVRKISPTQFEVRKRNFEPVRDIDVLIVEFGGGE